METIFLGIPVLEDFKAHCVDALLRLFNYYTAHQQFKLKWSMIIGSRQVHFARNALVNAGLDQGADYIAFLDADMTFPEDVLHRLYHNSKDICGVLYKGRLKPHPHNLFYWNKDKTAMEQVKKSWKPPSSKLIEVDAVGTGAMLIRSSVFKEVGRPYFFYESNRSEDIMFCQKCREHGIRVYIDTTLKCGHIGEHIIE